VAQDVRRSWKPLVEGLLARRRHRIALALLVLDARHGPTEMDLAMRDWLEGQEVPYAVAATKADKLSSAERQRAGRWLAAAGAPAVLVSETGMGMRELWKILDTALHGSKEGHAPHRV
jgi:GTP-binding protein